MDDDIEVSNRIRFFWECAADCRTHAAGARVSQSRDVYLELAGLWEHMAEELQALPAAATPESSGEDQEAKRLNAR